MLSYTGSKLASNQFTYLKIKTNEIKIWAWKVYGKSASKSWVHEEVILKAFSYEKKQYSWTYARWFCLLWMDNDHGLCDGPMFTIGRSSKSQPWCWLDCQINKETGKKCLPICKGYAVFYFWVFWCRIARIQNLHHSYCIRSIPGHCDLQTDILNCLCDIISCPQIDLTLPVGALA